MSNPSKEVQISSPLQGDGPSTAKFDRQSSRILESISDGFYALDKEWRFIYVNKRGREILRPIHESGEGLIGKIIWEEFPSAAGTDFERNYRKAIEEQVTVEFETYFAPLQSWYVVRAYPTEDGLTVYFLDITRRKQMQAARSEAEAALRLSEERFRATFNQAAVGIAVARLDGHFEQVNSRFAEILGYSAEELEKMTFVMITHPDDLAKTRENVQALLASEMPRYVQEKRYIRKDGGIVWSLSTITLLRNSDGVPERFLGVIENITQRKQSEEDLRQTAERLQLALSAGRLRDWAWDPQTDLITFGPEGAELFGLAEGTTITWEKLRERLHEEDRELAVRAVEYATTHQTDYKIEYRVKHSTGWRWIAANGRGVYALDGSFLRMIGVLQDITTRKQQEAVQSRLVAVVESSDDAIISMDLDTRVTTWNKGAQLMLGYTADEIIGQSVNKLLPPDREDEEPRIIQQLLRGERIEHYETRRVAKDGRVLDVSLTVSAIYGSHGRVIGVSKILRDITERKRAEVAIRQSEENLRALANSISQLAWMANPDGHIFWYNERWFDYTGTTMEQMEGWGWQTVHDPKMLPSVLEKWKESIATGAPFEMEFPLRGADGEFRWFLTLVNPLRDADGKVIRWFGTNTDVDELRRVEQALREESRVLELLNEAGRAIGSQLDINTTLQTVTDSATRLSGAQFGAFFYNGVNEQGESYFLYTLSGAPREAFEKFGHPRATPMFGPTFRGEPPIRLADVTQDPRYGKMPPHHGMPKGHLPVRSYLAVPVISRNGDVIGGLFFGHPDVGVFTEKAERLVSSLAAQAAVAIDNARLYDAAQHEIVRRTKVEEELRTAQGLLKNHAETLETLVAERTAKLRETIGELEAFSYSVSHDMRSPLRAMQGYSDALLEEYGAQIDDIGKDYLNRIKRAASRMDLLIQDVLAYSRVAQGEVTLQPVSLEAVIQDVIQAYPNLSAERAEIKIVTPLPRVLGHEAYLTQLTSNILTNGVKFVAPGVFPQIQIGAAQEGDYVRIYFKDNGIGIAPEHQQQIFQIFGRVYSEKQYEGTGIGLAIAKKATERMGGTIEVESQLGKGSTFSVRLKTAF